MAGLTCYYSHTNICNSSNSIQAQCRSSHASDNLVPLHLNQVNVLLPCFISSNDRTGESYCLPSHLLPTAHQIADTRLASTLPADQAKDFLTTCYLGLLDDAIQNLRLLSVAPGGKEVPTRLSRLSYNLILTSEWMILVPRSSAEYYFSQSGGDKDKLSLNSLAFAGSAFLAHSVLYVELMDV